MTGDYSKDMYRQMCELFEQVEALKATVAEMNRGHKEEMAEIKQQHKEEMASMEKRHSEELAERDARIEELERQNGVLLEEVTRLKSDRNNNSGNSSNPPSSDQKGTKKANEYNGRKKTGKKKGAQHGHKGITLTKETVEKLLSSGQCRHVVREIGDSSSGRYTTKYEIDILTETQITEYRIYEGAERCRLPDSEVFYGPRVKALTVELYGIGVVSFKRIQEIIWSITNKAVMIAAGTLYGFCCKFSKMGQDLLKQIEERILDGTVAYTDATVVTIDGVQGYIRNVSNEYAARYYAMERKNLETLNRIDILARFAGILVHDHETAIYHFGVGHAECNTHLLRYLLKNTEDAGNSWSGKLSELLLEMKRDRDKAILEGRASFSTEKVENYHRRYGEILSEGFVENRSTSPKWAKREEASLLNRLSKYMKNHLLFLENFEVAFTNNLSERDLRKCKNRQKVSGGFRNMDGCRMFADILSIIETAKRQQLNPYNVIRDIFQGSHVAFQF